MTTTIKKLEAKLGEFEKLLVQLSDRISKLEGGSGDFLKLESRIGDCEARNLGLGEILKSMDQRLGDAISRTEACVLRLDDWEKDWPALQKEEYVSVAKKNIAKTHKARPGPETVADYNPFSPLANESNEEDQMEDIVPQKSSPTVNGRKKKICRTLLAGTKDEILVLGDSLSRGAGHKLKEQCGGNIVKVLSTGGARLKDIGKKIQHLEPNKSRHLVIIGGANNMQDDTTPAILEDYGRIVNEAIDKGNKRITVLGLMKRYDLPSMYESKRILINMELKKICAALEVDYLEYEPERSRVHGDGLHLNWVGQNELGRVIFQSVKSFLV